MSCTNLAIFVLQHSTIAQTCVVATSTPHQLDRSQGFCSYLSGTYALIDPYYKSVCRNNSTASNLVIWPIRSNPRLRAKGSITKRVAYQISRLVCWGLVTKSETFAKDVTAMPRAPARRRGAPIARPVNDRIAMNKQALHENRLFGVVRQSRSPPI